MSNPVSALNGAQFDGIATVRDDGLHGMITLRGDLASSTLAKAAKSVTGLALPKTGEVTSDADGAICWMSPDELLLVGPYTDVSDRVSQLQKALVSEHALAVDVSDARAVFTPGSYTHLTLPTVCSVCVAVADA